MLLYWCCYTLIICFKIFSSMVLFSFCVGPCLNFEAFAWRDIGSWRQKSCGSSKRDLGKRASPPSHINTTSILRGNKVWTKLASHADALQPGLPGWLTSTTIQSSIYIWVKPFYEYLAHEISKDLNLLLYLRFFTLFFKLTALTFI